MKRGGNSIEADIQ
jgi:hypothetical protein